MSPRSSAELTNRQHLAVLTEASAALTGAGLDPHVVLDTITDLLVEHMGDSALVYVLGANGVDFEVGAITSRNPEAVVVAQQAETAAHRVIDDDSFVARCARQKAPILLPRVDLLELDPPLPPAYRKVIESTPIRSLAYVPLINREDVLGVLTVTRILPLWEPMDEADLDLLCDLAELASSAVASTRVHRDLAYSTALFETAFHAAPIGMALVSVDDDPGRLVRVNASMSDMTGYSAAELLAMRVAALFPADVQQRIEDGVRSAASGELRTTSTVGRLVRRDGTEVSAQVDARGVQVPGRRARIGLLQVQVPPGRMSPGGGGSGV